MTYLIYDLDPQANPLARVVAYADGCIPAVAGVFGIEVQTPHIGSLRFQARVPTFTREESQSPLCLLQHFQETMEMVVMAMAEPERGRWRMVEIVISARFWK